MKVDGRSATKWVWDDVAKNDDSDACVEAARIALLSISADLPSQQTLKKSVKELGFEGLLWRHFEGHCSRTIIYDAEGALMFLIKWKAWKRWKFETLEEFTGTAIARECLSSPILDRGKETPNGTSCVREFSKLLPY